MLDQVDPDSLAPFLAVLRERYHALFTSAMKSASDWWIQRKLIGWALLDMALQQETGILLTDCRIELLVHGKPVIANHPDVHFNLSHSKQYFLVGLSPEPIGVDIETERKITPNLAEKVFTEKEQKSLPSIEDSTYTQAFLRIWTKKESYTKALGTGYQGLWNRIETAEIIDSFIWKTFSQEKFVFSVCYHSPQILVLHPLMKWQELADFYRRKV
jgi:4'-phosphopantetheinyl transferase